MRNIFIYKDDMVDLNQVACIEFYENEVTFYMTRDWEYCIEIEDKDIERVKIELATKFNQ